jgi:hypothetical protein
MKHSLTSSGTVQSIRMPPIKMVLGSGSFYPFGILVGGDSSDDPAKVTKGCWFDNLNYDNNGNMNFYSLRY